MIQCINIVYYSTSDKDIKNIPLSGSSTGAAEAVVEAVSGEASAIITVLDHTKST